MRKDVTFYNNVQEVPARKFEREQTYTVVLRKEHKILIDTPRLCAALQNVWNQKSL